MKKEDMNSLSINEIRSCLQIDVRLCLIINSGL